jgi:hypothetical protein
MPTITDNEPSKRESTLINEVLFELGIIETPTTNNESLVSLNKNFKNIPQITRFSENNIKYFKDNENKLNTAINAIIKMINEGEFVIDYKRVLENDLTKTIRNKNLFKKGYTNPLNIALEKLKLIKTEIDNEKLAISSKESTLKTTQPTLKIQNFINLDSNDGEETNFSKSDQLLRLEVFANDDIRSLQERISILQETKRILIGKENNNSLDDGKTKNLEILSKQFIFFSNKIKEKGVSYEVDLDKKTFTESNIDQMREVFSNDRELLRELDNIVSLIEVINKQTNLISNISTILNQLIEKKNDEVIDLGHEDASENRLELNSKNTEIIISQIYELLRIDFSSKYKDASIELPEYKEFFKLESHQAYDVLMTAVMERIVAFYDDALAGGETSFEVSDGSDNLWGNDHFFEISNHDSHGLTSLKFFLENFPWDKFVPDNKLFNERDKVNFRKKISNQFKYRILAIQNAGNSASEISNLFTGNEHGGYYKDIWSHFAKKGNDGGRQSWDLAPYNTNQHTAETNEGKEEAVFRELFTDNDGRETAWLMPFYENYFIREVTKKYANKITLADDVKLKELKVQLSKESVDGNPTILGKLHGIIINNYSEDRLKKDSAAINLASRKALWTIVNTLQIHQWDINGIHSKIGRVFNPAKYLAKAVMPGQGMNWRYMPVERAALSLEVVTYFGLKTKDHLGRDAFSTMDENDLGSFISNAIGNNNQPEIDWLLDLKQKSLDRYSVVKTVEDYNNLDVMQDDLKETMGILMNRRSVARIENKIAKLSIKLNSKESNKITRNVRITAQAKIGSLQIKVNAYYEHKKITDFKNWMELKKRALRIGVFTDKQISRFAGIYAISKRYKVILMNNNNTGLTGVDKLPIAIPIQKYILGISKGVISIPMKALRDGQINSNLIDFSKLPTNPNSSYAAFMIDAIRWFGFMDATEHDSIFPEIKNRDLQSKLRSKSLVNGARHASILLKLKTIIISINAMKIAKNRFNKTHDYKNTSVNILIDDIDALFRKIDSPDDTANLRLARLKESFNLEKGPYFKLGMALDALLRERVSVATIEPSELEAESDDEGKSKKSIGMGFPDINKYAAKYLQGKAPEFESLLEMFRHNNKDIHEFIHEARTHENGTALIRAELKTPVPAFLRDATDSFLDGKQQLTEAGGDEIKIYKAKSLIKRAEKEFIVGCFWIAVQGYLDQYALSIDDRYIPIELDQVRRATFLESKNTTAGAKPMNYADRHLFIHYVAAMLDLFKSPVFASGAAVPRNIMSVADLIAMMEKRGMFGSVQIMTDLAYLEDGGQDGLKSKNSK